ncbi:MAG TPA: gliding motility-associated C-terminal domain-containing protein [Chitinophagaceae bacterium]|nr:gliding motility-associated C-terminal domain-containing protein [Chitinophagaceae bacterium]
MRTLLALVFCVSAMANLHAQLCQGSLGDPVVKVTFGAGVNPGPALQANSTRYQYVATDCPNDGFYTIRSKTNDCFGDTWNFLDNDHTGDANGYFMLVNASIEPSDFYVTTVKGLCPGTTYEFAAWVTNMLRSYACGGAGIKPNITFTIESPRGDILGKYETGDIEPAKTGSGAGVWKQYGLYFTTPTGTPDVVVRMRNNAPGGCGNDLALDDITFRPCGPKLEASIVNLPADTADACFGQDNAYTLSINMSAGFNSPVYQWQTSTDGGVTWNDIANAQSLVYNKPQTPAVGQYLYRMSAAENGNMGNGACRINSGIVAVNVNPLPQINVSKQYSLCTNDTLILAASGGATYNWLGPNSFSSADSVITVLNPPASYSGNYYVQAVSGKDCSSYDTIAVTVFQAAVATAGNDVSICEGSSTQLTGGGGLTYSWSPATGLSSPAIYNPVASPSDSTLYILTVTDANNCVVKDSVAVNVLKKPRANAGTDKIILEGETVKLDGSAAGTNVVYAWRPPYNLDNESSLQPLASPLHDTTYTLTVTSLAGCGIATDDVFVRVLEKLQVPNAFSPNGDGINDTWNIQKLITYPEADIYVFNRFGQVVYHSRGYSKPWDGTFKGALLPFGTYYYMIDLKNGLPKLSGWLQILR